MKWAKLQMKHPKFRSERYADVGFAKKGLQTANNLCRAEMQCPERAKSLAMFRSNKQLTSSTCMKSIIMHRRNALTASQNPHLLERGDS